MNPLFAASIYFDLPVFLIVFSLVYSATRHDRWDRIFAEALGWAGRVGGFLLMVGVGLYVASSIPDRWPYLLVVVGIITALWYGLPYYLRHRKAKQSPPPTTPAK